MKNALVALVAVAMGTLPALAVDGPGRALLASNNVQISDNPVQSVTDGGSIYFSFIPPYSGTVRLRWEIKSKDGTIVGLRGYVPNLSICTKESSSTGYVAQSCDLRVAGGLPFTIVAYANESTNTIYLKNLSVSFTEVDSDGKSIVWVVPPQG